MCQSFYLGDSLTPCSSFFLSWLLMPVLVCLHGLTHKPRCLWLTSIPCLLLLSFRGFLRLCIQKWVSLLSTHPRPESCSCTAPSSSSFTGLVVLNLTHLHFGKNGMFEYEAFFFMEYSLFFSLQKKNWLF